MCFAQRGAWRQNLSEPEPWALFLRPPDEPCMSHHCSHSQAWAEHVQPWSSAQLFALLLNLGGKNMFHKTHSLLFIFNTRPRTVKGLFLQKNRVDRFSQARKVHVSGTVSFHGLPCPRGGVSTTVGIHTDLPVRLGSVCLADDPAQARQVRTQLWTGNGPHNRIGLEGSGVLFPTEGAGGEHHTPAAVKSCQSLLLWVSNAHPAVQILTLCLVSIF